MDNITHSLYGALAAEVLLRAKPNPKRSRVFESAFRWTLAIGNNFPDLDVLYAGISPGPLGRILHHRGHTHTIGLAVPQALLILIGVFGFLWAMGWRSGKRVAFTVREWMTLAGTAVLGVCMHMAADWTNSYGVHPFWPWSNAWTYGDAVFILEPLLWVVIFPWVIWTAHAKFFRGLGIVLMMGLGGLALFSGLVPWGAQLAVFTLSLTLLGTYWRIRNHAWWISSGLVAVVLAGWFVLADVGQRGVREAHAVSEPEMVLGDIAMSPLPANPFCLRATTVGLARSSPQVADPDLYRTELMVFAPWPRLYGIDDCLKYFGRDKEGGRVAWEEPGRALGDGRVQVFKRFEAPRAELESLWKTDCYFRDFLRFSRMPIWEPREKWLGDLRFDMGSVRPGSRTRFLEADWKEASLTGACVPRLPKWDSPLNRWWPGGFRE